MNRNLISLGAMLCGLVAAVILPGNALGLGLFVTAVLIYAVVIAARPAEISIHTLCFGALSAGLVSMVVVRAAGWVVWVDLLAAACFASLAVRGGETWRSLVRGALAVGTSLLRGLGFVLQPLRSRLGPALRGRSAPVMRGVVIGMALLVVFGALFASADRAFLHLASSLFSPDVEVSQFPARVFLLALFTAVAGALVVAGPRFTPATEDDAFGQEKSPRALGFPEWSISLGLLNVLFATFVIVQLTVLFGGRAHVLDTVDLSYAEYARSGFFQLVAVALLALGVIAASVRWASADSRKEIVALRSLMGLLCVFTLVVLGSALKRLMLYEDVYGLTRLRVSVHASILFIAAVFILVIIAGLLWKGSWLPRAFAYLVGISLLTFSLANPEGLIARQNADRFMRTGKVDVGYLQTLSADAALSLDGLNPLDRKCILLRMGMTLSGQDGWAAFNLARNRARSPVETARTSPALGACPDQGYYEFMAP